MANQRNENDFNSKLAVIFYMGPGNFAICDLVKWAGCRIYLLPREISTVKYHDEPRSQPQATRARFANSTTFFGSNIFTTEKTAQRIGSNLMKSL